MRSVQPYPKWTGRVRVVRLYRNHRRRDDDALQRSPVELNRLVSGEGALGRARRCEVGQPVVKGLTGVVSTFPLKEADSDKEAYSDSV